VNNPTNTKEIRRKNHCIYRVFWWVHISIL